MNFFTENTQSLKITGIYHNMNLTYKYRICPTKAQIEALEKSFNFCNFLYNSALQERISFYKKFGKSRTYYQQCAFLPEIKSEFAEQTNTIYSQSLQVVLKTVDNAFLNFFRKLKLKSGNAGFPRYKSRDRFKSISFPQCNLKVGGIKRLDNNKLKIFGLPGEVKVKWHRPFKGRCKQVQIIKKCDKYYMHLVCVDVPKEPLPKTCKTSAFDLGITAFITRDDGAKLHHPKPYNTAKEKLAYLQKKMSNKKKGSKSRKRAKYKLAKAFERVTNIRNDFLNKVAKQLVNENDIIILENLNIKNMMLPKQEEANDIKKKIESKTRRQNITDASWGRFATMVAYKAERADKKLILVNPANTSKMCSRYRIIKNMPLEERTYNCQSCGLTMDRDHNTAKNIYRLGTSLGALKTSKKPTTSVVGSSQNAQ